jgi:hypothetical protein
MELSLSIRSDSRRRNCVVSPSAGLVIGKSDGTVIGGDVSVTILVGAGTEGFFFRCTGLDLRWTFLAAMNAKS